MSMDAAVKIALEMLVLGGQKTDRFPWRPSGQGEGGAAREGRRRQTDVAEQEKKLHSTEKSLCSRVGAWSLRSFAFDGITVDDDRAGAVGFETA
jgi:hypothetical protein